mmetsp:Transcript_10900/g.26676  ORF Transcript_10900/g.26676 Transcript_10900/m.26676 type:complete len:240 (+) Transcript_10900:86-805(+)
MPCVSRFRSIRITLIGFPVMASRYAAVPRTASILAPSMCPPKAGPVFPCAPALLHSPALTLSCASAFWRHSGSSVVASLGRAIGPMSESSPARSSMPPRCARGGLGTRTRPIFSSGRPTGTTTGRSHSAMTATAGVGGASPLLPAMAPSWLNGPAPAPPPPPPPAHPGCKSSPSSSPSSPPSPSLSSSPSPIPSPSLSPSPPSSPRGLLPPGSSAPIPVGSGCGVEEGSPAMGAVAEAS